MAKSYGSSNPIQLPESANPNDVIEYQTSLTSDLQKQARIICAVHDMKPASLVRVLWNWYTGLPFEDRRKLYENTADYPFLKNHKNYIPEYKGVSGSCKIRFFVKDAIKIETVLTEWSVSDRRHISFKMVTYKLLNWIFNIGKDPEDREKKIAQFKSGYYDLDELIIAGNAQRVENLNYFRSSANKKLYTARRRFKSKAAFLKTLSSPVVIEQVINPKSEEVKKAELEELLPVDLASQVVEEHPEQLS
jgi:hypothetical protein